MNLTLSKNSYQTDLITKYIFPLSTVILILLFYLACSGAALSPYLAFGCEQDEFGAFLIQLAMLFTGLSWPIVIVGAITISRRYYLNKAYKKALYVRLYSLINVPLFIGLYFLSRLLFGECDGPYIH